MLRIVIQDLVKSLQGFYWEYFLKLFPSFLEPFETRRLHKTIQFACFSWSKWPFISFSLSSTTPPPFSSYFDYITQLYNDSFQLILLHTYLALFLRFFLRIFSLFFCSVRHCLLFCFWPFLVYINCLLFFFSSCSL